MHVPLLFITETDAGAFARKFAEQPHDEDQVMHTFRELILGAFLASNRLSVRSEWPVAGKTPDWCILDGEDLSCIIELVNFHNARPLGGHLLDALPWQNAVIVIV